jgi:DNA invertase Pin-like site-specific DNA recombinase
MSTTNGSGTPAIVYAAKSTEDPRGSIPTQLADCRKAAEAEGREVVDEYSDENASAFKGNRGGDLAAAKDHAIRLATKHGAAEFWIQHSDRVARGDGITADHLAEVWFALRRYGVRLRSVQDDHNLEDAIRVVLVGERNHEDSARKSEAVKSGMARRKAKGMHNGGPRKYGYEYVRDEYGRTVGDEPQRIVPAEAVVIERVYAQHVAGQSQQAIVRGLNHDGIKSAKGATWYQGTVRKLLADPWYAGLVPGPDGALAPGQHEAIIAPELWEQSRALRETKAATASKGRGRPPKGSHLFTWGMLRCGRCGGAMVPQTVQRWSPAGEPWGVPYEAYRCLTRRRDVDACEQEPIKREAIDRAVMDYFESRALDVEATRRDIGAATARQAAATRELREQAERDERQAVERLARVKRDYMDGRLDADDWHTFRDELTAEQEAARAKLERLTEQEAAIIEDARFDVEAETLRYLAEIRAAVIGTVRDAQGVEAVRAALLRLFEGFTLQRHAEPFDRDVFDTSLMGVGDGYELQPHVREDAIAGYGPAGITPKPKRTSLGVGPKTMKPTASP